MGRDRFLFSFSSVGMASKYEMHTCLHVMYVDEEAFLHIFGDVLENTVKIGICTNQWHCINGIHIL